MKLVILITAQVENGMEVAQSWQETGAPGVTIVRTHGLFTLQKEAQRGTIELPRMIGSMAGVLAHILDNLEERGQMLISVVDNALVDKLIDAASAILGDLSQPYNGVLFVLDVERAIGVRHHTEQQNKNKD